MGTAQGQLGQAGQALGGDSPFALLPGGVDLQQNILDNAQLFRLAVDGPKQPL